MEEKAIRRAAQEAVNDLELECEIKEVCRSPGGDEWCVQFSGNYSQFCDKFQDQFEKDNSLLVIREKIKRHLLKQVDKIRRSTGKTRRPKAKDNVQTEGASGFLGSPLKMIGDVLGGATQIAGGVIDRAAEVAEAARQTVVNMDSELLPAKVELSAESDAEVKRVRRKPSSRTTIKPGKAQTKRAAKTARKPSTRAGKKAKKASPASKKSGGKAKKASAKKSKKGQRVRQ